MKGNQPIGRTSENILFMTLSLYFNDLNNYHQKFGYEFNNQMLLYFNWLVMTSIFCFIFFISVILRV